MTADALENLANLLRDAAGFALWDSPSLAARFQDAAASAEILARQVRAEQTAARA